MLNGWRALSKRAPTRRGVASTLSAWGLAITALGGAKSPQDSGQDGDWIDDPSSHTVRCGTGTCNNHMCGNSAPGLSQAPARIDSCSH
jgi:hypothetical protein